jgi:RNA polymerase sigma factor (TIGR02999 family)
VTDRRPDATSTSALVARAEARDETARTALFTSLYAELHRIAQSHVRRSGDVTLSATTVVHEAYLAMSQREGLSFPDRNRFFAYASRAMRTLVVDYIRERRALKRGGDLTFTTLPPDVVGPADPIDHDRMSAALDALAAVEPQLAELVDLKFYCGLTLAEIAAMRGASERTAQRDWAKARVLLHEYLQGD